METLGCKVRKDTSLFPLKKPLFDFYGSISLKTFCIIAIIVVSTTILIVDREEIYDHLFGFGDDTFFTAKVKTFSSQPQDWVLVCNCLAEMGKGKKTMLDNEEYQAFHSLGLVIPEIGSHETLGEMTARCNDFYVWGLGKEVIRMREEKERLEQERIWQEQNDAVSIPQ